MATPYRLYADSATDFEARVRVLRPDESGRQLPPYNGIRWDFRYVQSEPNQLHMMLYPDFFHPATGDSWLEEMPLPVDEWLHVRVSVFSEEVRSFHQAKIRVGTQFYYCEGSRIAAEGTVTCIVGLFGPQP